MNARIGDTPPMKLKISDDLVKAKLGSAVIIRKVDPERYSGDYVITPSAEPQVLQTKDLMMTENLTVNPVPSNYGLITWNGTTLTVS